MVNASRPFLAVLALGCTVGLGVTTRGAAQAELPKNSPFMSTSGPAAATAPSEIIEFAAVRTIGKRTEIDLYDTQGKKNHWIPVGSTVDGMTVIGYDARRDQVTAKINGVNKTFTLRQTRGVAAGNAAISAPAPAMSFGTPIAPTPYAAPVVATGPAANPSPVVTDPNAAPDNVSAPTAPAPTPAQPAAPLTIARQEEEARMLVSDLLEIGMAQRKAYEEKQKQAANPNATPPATDPNTPAPIPGGPPSGE